MLPQHHLFRIISYFGFTGASKRRRERRRRLADSV
eukprot:COSAG02_NODE_71383_length_191_cov_33.967391_1_plen_34_part_01